MKKVIFGKASNTVIHVDDTDDGAIIGFAGKEGVIRGVLALINGGSMRGITLVNGAADADFNMPSAHPYIEGGARIHLVMRKLQDDFDFFVFRDMEECLKWVIDG